MRHEAERILNDISVVFEAESMGLHLGAAFETTVKVIHGDWLERLCRSKDPAWKIAGRHTASCLGRTPPCAVGEWSRQVSVGCCVALQSVTSDTALT